MRTVELAKVAAAAEALRLRRIAHRQGMRAAFGAGAAVFGIAVLILLHVVLYLLIRMALSPLLSSLIVLAVDVVAAGVLTMLALSNKPDAIETEALQVRKQAVVEMKQSLTMMAMAAEIGGLVMRRTAATGGATGPRGHLRLLAAIAGKVSGRA